MKTQTKHKGSRSRLVISLLLMVLLPCILLSGCSRATGSGSSGNQEPVGEGGSISSEADGSRSETGEQSNEGPDHEDPGPDPTEEWLQSDSSSQPSDGSSSRGDESVGSGSASSEEPSGSSEGQTGPSEEQPGSSEGQSGSGSVSVPQPSGSSSGETTDRAAVEGHYSDHVWTILEGMTLREKVCQMIMASPTDITGVSKVTVAGNQTKAALEKYPVGALDYNKTNMVSQSQVKEMLAKTQSYSKIPLILTCDEEGGRVARLMNTIGTTWVKAMLDYKDQGPETARANAVTISSDMARLGFNMDLAPVADVWSNPENTVIGDRAYSDDFDQAAELLPAAVEGFHQGGVACVIKHFPGHGGTSGDSHYGSVYVHKTLDELREQELKPFQAAIDAGADSVMMGHLIVEDISSEPAVFSYEIVTDLLRHEMGFKGVVMTDALAMKAIADHYSNRQVAVGAIKAGVDMLLSPMDLDDSISAILSAVETGEITEARINESVLRILQLKENRGIL